MNAIIRFFYSSTSLRIANSLSLVVFSLICAGDVFTFAPNYYLFVFLLAIINGCYSIRLFNLLDAFVALAAGCYVLGFDAVTFRGLITFPGAVLIVYGLGFGLGRLIVNSRLNRWRFDLVVSLQVLFYYLLFLFLVRNVYIGMAYWGVTGFIVGYLMLKRTNRITSALTVFVPFWLLFITISFFGGILHWIGGAIAASLLGVLFAKVAYSQGRAWLWGLVNLAFCAVVIPVLSENIGYAQMVTFWNVPAPEDRFLYGQDTVTLQDFKGKVLVLDFWHTRCGSCFRKFPELERLQKEYERDDRVMILAVNIPIREDTVGEGQAKMSGLGYTFEKLYALENKAAAALGVSFYPTIIYIDRDSRIRYKGQLELNRRIFNNTESLIERLLKGS